MKTLLKLFVGCMLGVTLSSCYVTGALSDDYGEAYVNYYPYYFCPDMNFYYNPDLNIYWWHQEGMWLSGPRLPYSYHVSYNATYFIVSVSDRNPTRYYSQHISEYRRGDYNRSMYHYGDRPMQSLRSYRPDRAPSGYRRSGQNDDIYSPRRSSGYDNRGTRGNTVPQNNGSRSSDNWQNGSRNNGVQPANRPTGDSNQPDRTPQYDRNSVIPARPSTRPSSDNTNSVDGRRQGGSRQQSGSDRQNPSQQPATNYRQDNSGSGWPNRTQPNNNTYQNRQTARPSSDNTNSSEGSRQGGWRQQSGSDRPAPSRQPSTETIQRQPQAQPANNDQRRPQSRDAVQPRQQGSRAQPQSAPAPAVSREAPKKAEEASK